jgi:UDP-3-O-[3-hydroxymyristoyl] glucosamine N-acyltransferase
MAAIGKRSFTLGALADELDAGLVGDADVVITGLGSLEAAIAGQISHYSSSAYKNFLATTQATAVILAQKDCDLWTGPALVAANPYLAFARLSHKFANVPELAPGINASACVANGAQIAASAAIGSGVVIGQRTVIGEGVRIYANSVVGTDCVIGDEVVLMPNVVIYADVHIGKRGIVHSGSVIGADGFGFTPDEDGRLVMIAQIGGVRIADDVNIGACTTIDRGTIDHTVIEEGVKIDNQVMIGHNCRIGAHSVLCGCVGLVGSSRIGRHCILAGGAGIGGDGPVELCDGVVVTATTHVTSSITEPGVYSGGVLHSKTRQWKRNALRFSRLDELYRRVVKLEKSLHNGDEG